MKMIEFSRICLTDIRDFVSDTFPYNLLLRANLPLDRYIINAGDPQYLPREHWMNKQSMDENLWHLTEESKWK